MKTKDAHTKSRLLYMYFFFIHTFIERTCIFFPFIFFVYLHFPRLYFTYICNFSSFTLFHISKVFFRSHFSYISLSLGFCFYYFLSFCIFSININARRKESLHFTILCTILIFNNILRSLSISDVSTSSFYFLSWHDSGRSYNGAWGCAGSSCGPLAHFNKFLRLMHNLKLVWKLLNKFV